MRKRHAILLILAVLSVLVSLGAARWQLSPAWVESLCSNLGAGFLGAFLTVLLIDRAIARERETEARRIRALCLGQTRSVILRYLELLCSWYKAAVKEKPSHTPSSLRDIFSEGYYEELLRLDFSKGAPTSPPINWFRWSATTAQELRAHLNAVLDKYAFFLDADTLEIIEGLASSPFLGLLQAAANWPSGAPPTSRARTYNLLAGTGIIGHLRQDVELLLRLVARFNESVPRQIVIGDLPLWREDIGGTFGAARMSDEDMLASNPMIMMGRGLPGAGGPPAASSKVGG